MFVTALFLLDAAGGFVLHLATVSTTLKKHFLRIAVVAVIGFPDLKYEKTGCCGMIALYKAL